eukprot:1192994-Prorocentrum_minimum.AAC.3
MLFILERGPHPWMCSPMEWIEFFLRPVRSRKRPAPLDVLADRVDRVFPHGLPPGGAVAVPHGGAVGERLLLQRPRRGNVARTLRARRPRPRRGGVLRGPVPAQPVTSTPPCNGNM